jgi:hypothetical protein
MRQAMKPLPCHLKLPCRPEATPVTPNRLQQQASSWYHQSRTSCQHTPRAVAPQVVSLARPMGLKGIRAQVHLQNTIMHLTASSPTTMTSAACCMQQWLQPTVSTWCLANTGTQRCQHTAKESTGLKLLPDHLECRGCRVNNVMIQHAANG